MLISASRRSDIPAFYSAWLLRRLEEGQALVPNPRNPKQVGLVKLRPDLVDCIIFWSKNPAPLQDKLDWLNSRGWRYYFSYTITSCAPQLEPGLPPREERIESFRRLAGALGPNKVDWRFDPVLLSKNYSPEKCAEDFDLLARQLRNSTSRCIVNFYRPYRHLNPALDEASSQQRQSCAKLLAQVARLHKLPLFCCSGNEDLLQAGAKASACIDKQKIEELCGAELKLRKDPGQPAACGCLQSIDLGMYNSCSHGCLYCYAVTSPRALQNALVSHDPSSPLLLGQIPENAQIYERSMASSLRQRQASLL